MSRPTRRSGRLTSDSELSDAESSLVVPGSATRRTSRRVSTNSSNDAANSSSAMNFNNVTTRRSITTTRTVTAASPTKQLAFDLNDDSDAAAALHRIDEQLEDDIVDDLELSQQVEGTPFRSSASIYTLKTPATVDEHSAIPYPQTPGQALGAADAIVYHTDACDSHHQDDHSNCGHASHQNTLHQFVSKAGGALNAIKRRFSMSGSSRENSEDNTTANDNHHGHSHSAHGHSHGHSHSAPEEDEYSLQTHSHGRAGQRRRKPANGFSSVDEVNDTADDGYDVTGLSDAEADPLITQDGSISPPKRRQRVVTTVTQQPHSNSFLRRILPWLLIPALLALLYPLLGRPVAETLKHIAQPVADTLRHIPSTLDSASTKAQGLYNDAQHSVTNVYHHYGHLPDLNIKQRASDYLHNSLDRLHWTRSRFHSTPEVWQHAVDWVKEHTPSLPQLPTPHLPDFSTSKQIPNLADYFRGSGSHDWQQSQGGDRSSGIDWKDITAHVRDSIANAIHTSDNTQNKALKQLSDKLAKDLHSDSDKHVKQAIEDAMKNARSELQSAISKSSSTEKGERDALAKQVLDHVQQQLQDQQKQWKDSVLDTFQSQIASSLKSTSSGWKDEVLSTIRKELDSKPDAAMSPEVLKSLRDEFSTAIGKHGKGNEEALKHLQKSLSDATSNWESSSSDLLKKVLAAARDEFATKVDHGELENKLTSLITKELHTVEQRLQKQISDMSSAKSKHSSSIKDASDVQSLIDRALERYAADWTEEVDYALKSSGGLILAHSSTHRPNIPETNTVATKLLSYIRTPIPPTYYGKPDQLITASNGVGECWPMNSTSGWIMIKLREPISPTRITYQHISPHIIPDNTTTPQRFVVYGVSDRQVRQAQMVHTNDKPVGDKLAEFTYINTGRQLQQFTLQPPADRAYQVITVAVLDNYGNPTYTCLYRVRVHGERVAPAKSTGQLPLYNTNAINGVPLNMNQRP